MITPDSFNDSEVLSRRHQPTIADLMRVLADPDARITFVVGAGLSIDSGLPSWRQLIQRIANEIGEYENVRFGELSMLDDDDLVRKAEYLLEALIAKRGNGTRAEVVRNALYRDYKKTEPGQISYALARLIKDLAGRVVVLTTNFDNVIDSSLSEMDPTFPVVTLSLDDYHRVDGLLQDRKVPVVHVHGRLGRLNNATDPDMGSLVLTESDFLRHGNDVRRVVVDRLKTSTTIFLGLSLTDPNMVGPLWDTREARQPAFVLAVPPMTPGASSIEESRAYGIVKNQYLSTELGLNPIFLKSYTQLSQLLFELHISRQAVDAYLDDSSPTSLAYGYRFERLLTACYHVLGYRVRDGVVEGNAAHDRLLQLSAITDVKSAATRKSGAAATTVAELLKQFQSSTKIKNELARQRHEVGDMHSSEESFAVLLWLRNFAVDGVTRYSIRIVASSEFPVGVDHVSGFNDIQIRPDSSHTASRALANGRGLFWNLPGEATYGVWHGVLSVPVRLWEQIFDDVRIPTTVGAASLITTHHYRAPHEDFPRGAHLSLLSALSPIEKVALGTLLEHQVQQLFTTKV